MTTSRGVAGAIGVARLALTMNLQLGAGLVLAWIAGFAGWAIVRGDPRAGAAAR